MACAVAAVVVAAATADAAADAAAETAEATATAEDATTAAAELVRVANGSERARWWRFSGGVCQPRPVRGGPELRRTATPIDHADDDPSAPSRASSAISCLNARSSERLTENVRAPFELSGWQQRPLHGEPKEWWLRVRVRSTVIVLGSGVHSSVTIVESDARAGRAVASDFARHDVEAGYTDVLWREQVLEGRIKDWSMMTSDGAGKPS